MKMKMNMSELGQFQKDTLETLDILYKNFLIQEKNTIEVFLGDFRTDGIYPETFFDTVRTLKKQGVEIMEYDREDTLGEEYLVGARNTPCCEVRLPEDFEEVYKKLTAQFRDQPEQNKKDGQPIKTEKTSIVIDEECGIYRKDDRKKIYPISGARKNYVISIYENKGTMDELRAIKNQSESIISAGKAKINKNVRDKLSVDVDLIVHQKTAGKYMINKQGFSFTAPNHIE